MSQSRDCLVTGAAGVIGFELVRQLLDAGKRVLAVDCFRKGGEGELRLLAARSQGRLRVQALDLAQPGAATQLPRSGYELAYHLAAIVGVKAVTAAPYETIAVNLRSTLELLDWARAGNLGAFLFASSSECYASGVDAGTVPVPTPEDVPLVLGDVALPRWSYAASKIAGESALYSAAQQNGGFRPIVVRFHNVYGPRMRATHVIPEFLERCLQRVDPFPVYGPEQTRSFLHVEDAARALVLLGEKAPAHAAEVYNIGSSLETGIGDLAELVFAVTGFRPRVESRPAPPGSVGRRVPDTGRLRALGFEARIPLEEGIRGCWAALRARCSPAP